MPVVTRSMKVAQFLEEDGTAEMDVDGNEPSEQSQSHHSSDKTSKRTSVLRKRNRKKTNDQETEKPRKRRRIQQSDNPSEQKDAEETHSPPKKRKKSKPISPKRQTNKKTKDDKIIQAVSKSERTTTNDRDQLSAEESNRIHAMQEMERALYEDDCKYVIGTDEAGRGPLAGPVVAAACYIPLEVQIAQLTDSKALTEEQREEIFEQLVNDDRVLHGVAVISEKKIDEINILQAALLGMRMSCAQVNEKLLARNKAGRPNHTDEKEDGEDDAKDESSESSSGGVDYILVDGNRDPRFEEEGLNVRSETVVKGDGKVYCIAAASIIAKVTRDRLMVEYDEQYPLYNFAQHKGYPTPQHKALVAEHGPCEIHRRSFEPIKSMVGWTRPKAQKKKTTTKKKGKRGRKTGKKKST